MAKFIMTVGDETLRVLTTEAEKRNLRVQQLIRAVIVPEWVRDHLAMSGLQSDRKEIASHLTRPSVYDLQREPVLQARMNRNRTRKAANKRGEPYSFDDSSVFHRSQVGWTQLAIHVSRVKPGPAKVRSSIGG